MEKDPLHEPVRSTQNIYSGGYLNLDKIQVEHPDGSLSDREIVKVKDAVSVLMLDKQQNVYLIRQHRPAIEQTIMEIPAGLVDHGEEEEASALRECMEETGYKPGKLDKLLTYAHAEGYSTGMMTIYLGTDVRKTGEPELESGEFVENIKMPFSQLEEYVYQNKFVDSKTIIATLLVKEKYPQYIK